MCVCVKGKVFELRYCTSIVTELKMRFSLRLNFVLFTALLEDDGRGIIMASPSILIHRWAAARSLNNIANIFFKASVVVYIGELPANPQGNSVSPFFNSRFPFLVQVSSWFECRATVSPSLCSLLHMHNRQVLRIGDKKIEMSSRHRAGLHARWWFVGHAFQHLVYSVVLDDHWKEEDRQLVSRASPI